MGVFGPAFDPGFNVGQIAEGMRTTINGVKNQGYVIVIDPTKKITLGRNVTTGASGTVLQFPLGSGPTRIKSLKRNLSGRNQTNDTTERLVQFWLDMPKDSTIPDIRPGFEMVVTNGGNDPYLVNYQHVVTSAINSSEAWQRTVKCVSNVENYPRYSWSFLLGQVDQTGVTIIIEYQDADNAWHPYFSIVTTVNNYHIPIFVGANFRATYSKAGFLPQTISVPTLVLHDDTVVTNITLVPTP